MKIFAISIFSAIALLGILYSQTLMDNEINNADKISELNVAYKRYIEMFKALEDSDGTWEQYSETYEHHKYDIFRYLDEYLYLSLVNKLDEKHDDIAFIDFIDSKTGMPMFFKALIFEYHLDNRLKGKDKGPKYVLNSLTCEKLWLSQEKWKKVAALNYYKKHISKIKVMPKDATIEKIFSENTSDAYLKKIIVECKNKVVSELHDYEGDEKHLNKIHSLSKSE